MLKARARAFYCIIRAMRDVTYLCVNSVILRITLEVRSPADEFKKF